MESKAITPYEVKDQDSLDSLAQKIGLQDSRQIRQYHNNVCPLNELLKDNHIKSGDIIYLPNAKEVERLNKRTQELLARKNSKETITRSTFYFPFEKLIKTYEVEIKKSTLYDSHVEEDTIYYEFKITNFQNKEGEHLFEISRDQFYINGVIPQTKIEMLGYECGQTLYPMQIVLTKNGTFKGFHNWKKIKERWLATKPKILDYYEGNFVKKYVAQFDERMKTSRHLSQVVHRDLVLNLLLNPYFKTHENGVCHLENYFFKDRIHYQIDQEIKEETERAITIVQKGKADEERSYRDIILPDFKDDYAPGMEKIVGDYSAQFKINQKTQLPDEIEAEWNIAYTPSKTQTTVLKIKMQE